MTATPSDIQKAAEIAVFAFEARIQGGEFDGLDPNGTEARDALKAEIGKAINAERERCDVAATEQTFDAHELAQASDYGRGMDHAARTILAAIRSPQPSPPKGA